MEDFGKQVKDWVHKSERVLKAALQEAIQETVEIAQKPLLAGGRMRIKTGFLRASILANIGSLPIGPTSNPDQNKYSGPIGEPVAATLLRWDPNTGDAIYVGWTANYARYREAHDGFMRGALEVWDHTVSKAVKKAVQRIA